MQPGCGFLPSCPLSHAGVYFYNEKNAVYICNLKHVLEHLHSCSFAVTLFTIYLLNDPRRSCRNWSGGTIEKRG